MRQPFSSSLRTLRCAALLLAVLPHAGSAFAQPQPLEGEPEKLGRVDFPVSCSAGAQREFNRAMALYHSYHFPAAIKSFNAVVQADPSCAMAHWGLALVAMDNPFIWPVTGKALAVGAAAIEQARVAGLKTQRERDYVAAADAMFGDAGKVPARTRQLHVELALEKMTRDFPEDFEAKVFHAMVLSANFDPNDKQYTNQLRAAQILERLYKLRPDHPGVAHYLIHTYDYPPLAARGRAAAERYRDIAPSAPHAVHMPSHIFTRLGMWKDSLAANAAVLKTTTLARPVLHSYDYMIYAHLQLGQDQEALRLAAQTLAMKKIDDSSFTTAFALAAIPARVAIERGRWSEASRLAPHPDDLEYPWPSFPHAQAVRVFARGLGAARAGDAAGARSELERLAVLRQEMTDARLYYWADQAEIQAAVVRAWMLRAAGRRDEALGAMKQAADREDATEKNVVTPGPIKPARELLGEMLLDLQRPREALVEFETTLRKEPNRTASVFGAARAAEAAGNDAAARRHFDGLAALLETADSDRRELAAIREFRSRAK